MPKLKNSQYFHYIVVAILSFLLDILIFNLFYRLTLGKIEYAIIISSYIARLVSSLINYNLNKYWVFKYKSNHKHSSFIKYCGLAFLNITISAIVVEYICDVFVLYATFIKVGVDLIIFVINFFLQKYWIFKSL